MSDDTDLNRHRKYIYQQGNMFIRLFKCCSDSVKIKLFSTFCVITYLWTKYSTSAMKKLVVTFNDIYRKLFGITRSVSMSAIYVTNNVNSLGVLLPLLAGTFCAHLLHSKNQLIRAIINSCFFFLSQAFTTYGITFCLSYELVAHIVLYILSTTLYFLSFSYLTYGLIFTMHE